jgi:hypothetical protein
MAQITMIDMLEVQDMIDILGVHGGTDNHD